MQTSTTPSRHSLLDLQIAVLRQLPTPVLVLSPQRLAIFANPAAERIFDSSSSASGPGSSAAAAAKGIIGRNLADLDASLVRRGNWDDVLDQAVARGGLPADGVSAGIEVVIERTPSARGGGNFLVLLNAFVHEDGLHYVLSFERSTPSDTVPSPRRKQRTNSDAGLLSRASRLSFSDIGSPAELRGGRNEAVRDAPDIPQIKRAIFDSSGVAAFFLSVDESFYLANKKAREILGNTMGGAQGCDGSDFRERSDMYNETFTRKLELAEFPALRLVRTKTPFSGFRCGFIHAETGQYIVLSVSGECVFDDETGAFIGGICWCKDLQEYSDFLVDQQQRKLESHETICDLMPHMVWTTTPDGNVDYYSKRWYEFTGLTREQSLGQGFSQVVHPEDLSRFQEKWRFHNLQGSECEAEVRYRRKDGIYKWMLARSCPLRDESGIILKWYGTTTDIHDLVMQRIEARRNKIQMLTVLAHAEVNLFSIDRNRIITMAEGKMTWDSETDIYDINNKSSLIGQDAVEVARQTQPGGVSGYEQGVIDILAGTKSIAQSEDKIGDKFYRTRMVAEMEDNTRDGGQKPAIKGVLGLSIDVTDMRARINLEIDNTRLVAEEQAARNSNHVKSQFLANMSHELRTPTAGVIGMAELLNEDARLSAGQREYVNSIQLSAKALLTIVNDILDFSKIESGRLDIEEVPFNLSKVLNDLCKLLAMFARQKGLDFVFQNTLEEDLEVMGDPGRIRQVLSNLLTNALKFTQKGSVKFLVSEVYLTPPANDDRTINVQFVIEDTGIGIEKPILDRLFQPFIQGDSSTARLYGGTGLGLTISQNLANLMHGSISLESIPDEGSLAKFVIPLKASTWTRRDSFVSSSPPNPGFKYYAKSSRSPAWTQPLVQRGLKQEMLNQQISTSMTGYSTPGSASGGRGEWTVRDQARHGSIDAISRSVLPEILSAEERRGVHVLVVEDNAINQIIAMRNIENLGFSVNAVWNGREALSYLLNPSATQPRPSIILMDVQMPILDGYEATKILRNDPRYSSGSDAVGPLSDDFTLEPGVGKGENTTGAPHIAESGKPQDIRPSNSALGRGEIIRSGLRDIPVIAMTASAINGDKERCYEAGMDDYLAKPVQKQLLEEMLVKWARRRRG